MRRHRDRGGSWESQRTRQNRASEGGTVAGGQGAWGGGREGGFFTSRGYIYQLTPAVAIEQMSRSQVPSHCEVLFVSKP